jgi:general secretion pathway protein K
VRHFFKPCNHAARAGSVLLVLLCVMALLSFLIINAAFITNQHGETQAARQGLARARQLAEMGVAVAAHPLVKGGDPLLRRAISSIERFEASVTTEEARLNLNTLLTEERMPVLERVFEAWGLSVADAQGLATILMDWTDADDLKRRPDSAEKLDYQQQRQAVVPSNRLFRSLDEVEQVPRMAELVGRIPEWRNWFTLRSSGQVDLNTASAEVIAAVTGASLTNARLLVQGRDGFDHLPNTADDMPVKSMDETMSFLGISEAKARAVQPLLTLQGQTKRVECLGAAGDSKCVIAVVMCSSQEEAQIAEWREFSGEAASRP